MKRTGFLLVLTACGALSASPALAADAAKQVATAAAHAGLAASADSATMTQSHLQHVINCLEGPTGADFNAAPGNPCKDLGAGAIPDSAPDARKPLEAAAGMAKKALSEADFAKAKAAAAEIKASLTK